MPTQSDRLRAMVDAAEPRIRTQVERALKALQESIPFETLERIIAAQDAFAAHDLASTLPARLQPTLSTLQKLFESGAAVGSQQIAKGLSIRTSFNKTNPLALAAARNEAARLVTQVTNETRLSIRSIIGKAFEDGLPPRDAARLIRPLIGLTEKQATAVANVRADLIASGRSRMSADAATRAYAEKLRRQRALMIARTETIAASTNGQLSAWKAAQQRGLLSARAKKVWITTDDDRLCPRCSAMDGKEAPVDGKFGGFLSVSGPPLHPNCRCTIGLKLEGSRDAHAAAETTAREDAQVLAQPSSAYKPIRPSALTTQERFAHEPGDYVPERKRLHDAIIRRNLKTATAVRRPVIDMFGGGPASGKSSTRKMMRLPKNSMTVNPDDVRERLPEYGDLQRAGDKAASSITHAEASEISKRMSTLAMDRRYNVVLDGVNNGGVDSMRAKVKDLRARYPERKIRANFVTVDMDTALHRVEERWRGPERRYVPTDYVHDTHRAISRDLPQAVADGLYDEVTLWDTNGPKPVRVMSAKGSKMKIHDATLWQRFLAKATQ